ncbi:hypothetical protein BsWGS_03515 [Bradybaena similaris]
MPTQAPAAAYSPFLTSLASMSMPAGGDATSIMSQPLTHNMIATKAIRADKFETTSDSGETVTSHSTLMDTYSYPTFISQVCREFQRGTCSRAMSECRYAHPADHIVVDATDNHVTVCMDFIKSKCTRDLCKYFHPPSHLQALVRAAHARNQAATVISNNSSSNSSALQSTIPGMVPAYKRIAVDITKGGIPVYQTNPLMSPLQPTSLMQLQQPASYMPMTFAGNPHSVPRF